MNEKDLQINEETNKTLLYALEIIGKMSDTQKKQSEYELEYKKFEAKNRLKKFICILIFTFILVLSCWSVFYVCYFNCAVRIEKSYINKNYNENVNINSN